MKYLEAYLNRTRHPEKNTDPTPKEPTKPTELGFDGFVGTQPQGIGPKGDLTQPKALQAHNALAREELDRYFEVVLPELSRLHQAGKLPSLAQDPLWAQVEAEWDKAAVDSTVSCDVEVTKKAMLNAIDAYEKGCGQGQLFDDRGLPK